MSTITITLRDPKALENAKLLSKQRKLSKVLNEYLKNYVIPQDSKEVLEKIEESNKPVNSTNSNSG